VLRDKTPADDPAPAGEFIRRHAIRALLVDQDDRRVLLIKMLVPDTDRLIWLAPGGGRETGETAAECLFREVEEETGHRPATCQGPVWHRRHRFVLNGRQYDQSEDFYLVPTLRFDPVSTNNPVEFEAQAFRGFKWWSLDEVEAAADETFVPRRFATYLRQLLESGAPNASIDVGL
jgi:8-oxo-dGTP pyrophosphatase MutT (NUDIX family)